MGTNGLESKNNQPHKETGIDLLLCDDDEKCAIVDAWQEVEAQQFNRPLTAIFSQIFVPPMFEIPPDVQILETETERLAKVLDAYEERLSKSKYLAEETYTLADLNHIPGLVYFPMSMLGGRAYLLGLRPLKWQRALRWRFKEPVSTSELSCTLVKELKDLKVHHYLNTKVELDVLKKLTNAKMTKEV
ncbi:Glutathione S-transferase, C-terminal [Dillenia turbinata]|uniref:glutathione transferase n=1 Tax=Dillenia turbinata TaxID=194707 RepID=A0AAN8V9L4_9MAGN